MITQYDMATGEAIATEDNIFSLADLEPNTQPFAELRLQTVAEAIAIEQQAYQPQTALMQIPINMLLK